MSSFKIIERPSPNHGPRPEGTTVELIVLHYTDMLTAEAALERLCDPAAEVSAHYLIDVDGTIHQLVDESRRAWHAGESRWRGRADLNSRSIGIELANPGHSNGLAPYPAIQMDALVALCHDIQKRWRLSPDAVVGHSDIAPTRKEDPGELFDWPGLARREVGAYPFDIQDQPSPWSVGPGESGPYVLAMQRLLATIGYDIPVNGMFCEISAAAVIAFQRRYRPWRMDGRFDQDMALRATWLAARDPAPATVEEKKAVRKVCARRAAKEAARAAALAAGQTPPDDDDDDDHDHDHEH